jgi:ketosteroid isomerase-like protein
MSLEEEVRQASGQYYAALTNLLNGDAGSLMQVWSRTPDVTAMNPYGGCEVGWEQLRLVFERVAQMCAGSQANVWLQDRLIRVGGDLAYEIGIESGGGVVMGKSITIRHRVTNIYRREANGWKMVHRHTDLNPAEQDVSSQLHSSQEEAPQTSVTAQASEASQLLEVTTSKDAIDALTSDFFRTVSFQEGNKPTYQNLYRLFTASGQIIKNSSSEPEIFTVMQFIEPRQRMVDAGELTSFQELEISEITEIFGNIAHRFSTYEKRGINQEVEFEGRGIISMQFVLTDAGWKISSMAWDDERPGLTLPDRYR